MVNVGKVLMAVSERIMRVPMRMWCARRVIHAMLMTMVLVMNMPVAVCQR